MRRAGIVCLALCLALPAAVALAHGLAPIRLELREAKSGEVKIRWSVSTRGTGLGLTRDGQPLRIEVPEQCESAESDLEGIDSTGIGGIRQSLEKVNCPGGLAGHGLRILGLPDSAQAVVIHYVGPDGAERTRTLAGTDDVFQVAAGAVADDSGSAALRRYVALGFSHILDGLDHVLFVLCLVLSRPSLGRLLWPITAFTLAHSVTLAASVLGWISVPGPPVEACIALSVVWMAIEAVRASRAARADAPLQTSLAPYTFAFGLLHGLGFAGVLRQVGLGGAHFGWALAGFNIGVELGQLCIVALLLAVLTAARRLPRVSTVGSQRVLAEVAGITGGYWLVERLVTL